MKIAIVVAFEKNRGIGKDGKIVWDFPSDRAYYKTLTLGNFVIFGRKTFEEFGKPLPGRINIVVSATKKFEGENLYTVKNLEAAIELAEKINSTNEILPSRPQLLLPNPIIFLCGGAGIYREGMNLAETIYTTQIDADYDCDTFFPEIDESKFKISEKKVTAEKAVKLSFITYSL